MTLKQFFQIAGGALVSLLIYSTNLNVLIKWPLILFFALLGVALAFLPFQERPLETWILAFFRSVYTPTLFGWNKPVKQTSFFQEEAAAPSENIAYPGGEIKLQEYLSNIAAAAGKSAQFLEKNELSFLSRLADLFNFDQKQTTPLPGASAPITSAPEVQKQILIPQTPAPTIPRQQSVPRLVVEEDGQKASGVSTYSVSPISVSKSSEGSIAAKFSAEAAPPSPPTTPNTIVGQVLSIKGKIIEGAILEVKDVGGRPLRALKSNKLGHFIVVTPLQNGRYEIITEKDDYEFKPVAFEAIGGIIPPIAIEGKEIT